MPIVDDQINQDSELAAQLRPGADRGDEATPTAPSTKSKYTPEQLKQHVQDTLVDVVSRFELETDQVRRHHVRRLLKAEEYWKGNQHLIWSEKQFRWYTPFQKAAAAESNTQSAEPRFQYANNIYRSWGLSVMGATSQRLPKVRFMPKSAKSERDIATARAASDVMDVIERNNNIDLMAIRCSYLMWTQGLIGAYVRYVVDDEYGTHDEPVIENQTLKIADDRYLCSNCGTETPADAAETEMGMDPMGMANCPQCQGPISDQDFQEAEYGEAPVVSSYKTYPNGQEKISLYGALQLKMMPTAETLQQSLYLILCEEQHQAAVRAAHPGKLKEITASPTASAADAYEKQGRMSLADAPNGSGDRAATQPFSKMITYKRAWLRPEAFYDVDEDEIREELLTQFPSGVFVALADNTFIDARAEDVDDKWRICRPMPGTGMYTDAVGADTLPIQDQFNDAQNLKAEHIEYGSAPPVLFDSRFIKSNALRNRRLEPGQWLPVDPEGAGPEVTIANMVHQPQVTIDSNIYSYGKEIVEYGQMICGAMPTIFGAPLQGNDTASGYSMARDQALGKLILFWRAVKQFWAGVALISVECFRKNRSEDYEVVVEERSQQYSSQYIHLEDLKGNVTAHPDADEDFPTTWQEIRENILNLIKEAPEIAQKYLLHPSNAPLLRKLIGSPDLVMPDEDDREKQYREIDELLQLPPNVAPDGTMQSTIKPELFVDNHDDHIATAREWAVGDKGIEAKKMNPQGYSNVMAHILDHIKAKVQEQQMLAMLQGPPPGSQPQQAAPSGNKPDGGGKTVGDAVEEAIPGIGGAINKLAGAKLQ